MSDMMGGMRLDDHQCLVALDDAGNGWVLARSQFYIDHDMVQEVATEDNGFNPSWDVGLNVGVYLLTLKPWSHHDSYSGEWDCGFDVIYCETVWATERDVKELKS